MKFGMEFYIHYSLQISAQNHIWGWFHKSWGHSPNHSSFHLHPAPTTNFWEAFYWRKCSAHSTKDGHKAQNNIWNWPQMSPCDICWILKLANKYFKPVHWLKLIKNAEISQNFKKILKKILKKWKNALFVLESVLPSAGWDCLLVILYNSPIFDWFQPAISCAAPVR